MNNPAYYPSTLAGKLAWMENFNSLVDANPATYGLTVGDKADVAAVVTPLAAAFTLASDPSTGTPVTRASRDTALRAAEVVVLPLAVSVSQNADIDPNNKLALGVTVRSTTRTTVPTPTAKPILSLRLQKSLVNTVDAFNSETPGKKGCPLGCTMEVFWTVGTVAATDPAQLAYKGKRTRQPFTLETVAADAGKVVSVTARYAKRNGTAGEGAEGPFSDIITFIAGSAVA